MEKTPPPLSPGYVPSPAAAAARRETGAPGRPRHVWLEDEQGRSMPGVLVRWVERDGVWVALVAYAAPGPDGPVAATAEVPADRVSPA